MALNRAPVSVLIPCYNSADVIGDCLESVSWADEIVVCDSFSTDATLEIARRYTNRIVQHAYVTSATQKNWAIPQLRHEWVLIVDTDERISPALRREIEAALSADCSYDGFRIPRLNHVFGRPIRHGGHYPDYQLRLFRRDRGRYQDRQVHAHVELQGRCGVLSAPLLHFGQRSVEQVTRTYLLRYTAWEAAQKDQDGVRFWPHHLIVRPLGAFVVRYLGQGGFRDGTAGLFMALLVGAYVFLTYARLWQLQSSRQNTGAPPSHTRGRPTRPTGQAVSAVPDEPVRVAFLAPHTGAGGAETNLHTLAAHLDRARVSPVVLAAGEGALTALLAGAGIPVTCVPTPRFFSTSTRLGILFGGRTVFNPVAVLADCLLLAWAAIVYARALRRARAQVVHTGSIFAHLLGALAAPLAGARLIWHVQDIVSPHLGGGLVLPSFARLGARRADLAVCPSEAVAAGLRAHWPADGRDRLRVVRNGLDLRPYDPALPAADVRRELGLPDEAFVAVHVGRLVPWKGQREFLEAARLVATQCPEAHFLVVGDVAFDGPAYRDALRRLVRRLGLEDRIVFTGWRRDMPVVLAAADVLVHSSVLPDPFGLVIVEAMAMERPVVASRLGGPGEIVRDGHEGVLVDPRYPEEIAEALLRLAADPALRTRLGRAGRVRALGCFGAERFVQEMEAVLHEAAGGCEARRR
jgi:glycosyltransferase involved in cell wall biosynthesis